MADQSLKPGCLPQLHGLVRFGLVHAFFEEPNGRGLAGAGLNIATSVFVARKLSQLQTLASLGGLPKATIYLDPFG